MSDEDPWGDAQSIGVWGVGAREEVPKPKVMRLKWTNKITKQHGFGGSMDQEQFAMYIAAIKTSLSARTRNDYKNGVVLYELVPEEDT